MRRFRSLQSWMDRRCVQGAVALGCLTLLVSAPGCSDAKGPGLGRTKGGWSQSPPLSAPREAVFDAGVYAMKQWFRLAEVSPVEGLIRSATEEYQQEGGTGRIRDDAVGYQNRMRRTASLVIREQGDAYIARCRIQVERLDTADHRVFRRQQQFGDVPNETPIDRDAGISPRQDQVWTPMPRDRSLERQILTILRSRVTGEDVN